MTERVTDGPKRTQLNMSVAPAFADLVRRLGKKYGMSQREVVEWGVSRLARSEGLLPPARKAEALDHLARADRLMSEMEANAEEARGAMEMALGALDPLPEEA